MNRYFFNPDAAEKLERLKTRLWDDSLYPERKEENTSPRPAPKKPKTGSRRKKDKSGAKKPKCKPLDIPGEIDIEDDETIAEVPDVTEYLSRHVRDDIDAQDPLAIEFKAEFDDGDDFFGDEDEGRGRLSSSRTENKD